MVWKRQELRKGNFIVLTDLDYKIINSLMYYLKTIGRDAIVTELYSQVRSDLNKPTLSNYKIWSCILILYIRHKISINNYRKAYQKQFRTYIKLVEGEKIT